MVSIDALIKFKRWNEIHDLRKNCFPFVHLLPFEAVWALNDSNFQDSISNRKVVFFRATIYSIKTYSISNSQQLDTSGMKSFFIKILLLCFSVFATIIPINYFVDPANIFGNGAYEKGISDYLIQGYHVVNIMNYDERLLQKFYIESLKNGPKTIVLGSSRSMQLSSRLLSQQVINNGVSGASVEDLLAIYN